MTFQSSGRFVIRRRLGEGGMGVVYEAYDQERRAAVALKTLNRFDAGALARFKREFRALQGLAHPNLVALDELHFADDQWFFTMELLDGVDFVSWVRGFDASAGHFGLASTMRQSVGAFAAARPVDMSNDAPPAASPFVEDRLRQGLRQLIEGIAALHAADRIHRDIKPSNVLVTRESRVVLLDFGLVMDASEDNRSTGSSVVGTPAYMSPEQAGSREVGPAADLYAVGTMLYEILTGKLPFEGAPLQILMEKQAREPAPPISIVPEVPLDLSALCSALLQFEPAKRPTASAIARTLPMSAPAPSALARTPSEAPPFVGRGVEMAKLDAAFREVLEGRLAIALVCGESGIGKSYLVRRFTSHVLGDHPETVLLEGRCYEREAVPYKTLDGIVDALSRRLSRTPPGEASALLPTRAAVLGQVFPVMLRVPQIAQEHARLTGGPGPHELRQRAFLSLRDLFTRIAVRKPTIIVIDDLQWADEDGLRALAEILRPPEAPPLLLIGTVRAGAGDVAVLERLRGALSYDARTIELSTLGDEDARELATAMLRRADALDTDPAAIAAEAGGHPLFLEELARHVALGGATRENVKLDDAIWARVLALEPASRTIAELVAVAGKPLPQEIVAAAARSEPGEFTRRAAVLRAANLVRTGGTRWADAIEPYHDRVREAVLAHVDITQRRGLHEALAIAYEASSHNDAEALAMHWREAKNGARAAKYAMAAGDQASRTFAFDHAARWYEEALELFPEGHATRRELRVKLGDALAFAGRGAIAAKHFELAAIDAPPMHALELRRRAAEHLLRSGHFDRGIEASRAVLASIGMRMPVTRFGTLLSVLYFRALLTIRGMRFREREAARITPEELTRIDTCWSIGFALAFADTFVGIVFSTRALLLALAGGELERIARSVGMESGTSGFAGGPGIRNTERLIKYAHELAAKSGSIASRFYATSAAGVAYFCNGRFRDAIDYLTRAMEMTEDGTTGLVFERASASLQLNEALVYAGRFRELKKLQDAGLRDALSRGDVYLAVNLRVGFSNFAWLIDDRADLAEMHARAALDEWSHSGFHLEHFWGLIALGHVGLYVGDPVKANEHATELLAKMRRSLLWQVQIMRTRAMILHGLAALAMLGRGLGDPEKLTRQALRAARGVDRESMSWASPFARVLRAGVTLHRGERRRATEELGVAARSFDAMQMKAYAAACRDRAALLRGEREASVDRMAAESLLREEQVATPARLIEALVPGFASAAP